MLCAVAPAHAAGDDRGGIEALSRLEEICVCITGDSFEYSRDDGLLTIEGNVEVVSSDFALRCDTLEVISDGREKPVIRAYPSVEMEYGDGLGEFNGGEFEYDFNTREGGFGQVEGVFHIDPERVDIDLEVPLDVIFHANSLRFYSNRFVMERPWWTMGRGERSDVRFYSLEIAADMAEGRITAIEVDRFVIRIFGVKLTLLPVRLRHGFVKRGRIGTTGFLPSLSYDADDGVGIDQLLFYTFHVTPTDETFISLRMNPYIGDRFYWQTGLNHGFPDGRLSLLYGPSRVEDPYDESQVVWSEPDLRLQLDLERIGDLDHEFEAYCGDIREASRDVERKRYGFEYQFRFKPAEYGNWSLRFSGALSMNFYEGGDDYSVFRRTVSTIYDGGRDFDFKLSYICNEDGGQSPFYYDRVEVREGVGLKAQGFFGERWGIASDLLYDIDIEDFERFGFGPIYVFESMQLGLIWDFEQGTVRILVGLPKQFV